MAEIFTDKPHPATPRRRQQARSRGHVAKSQDLVSALVMTGGLLALWIAGAGFGHFITDFTTQQLSQPSWQPLTTSTASETWSSVVMSTGRSLAPVMIIVMVVAIVANLAQTGFLFLPHRLAVDVNRILPMTGIRRWLSVNNLVQVQFGLGKTLVIITVAVFGLWTNRVDIMQLTSQDPQRLIGPMLQLIFTIGLQISFALIALALADYIFQRWQYERSLRLTDQEMREELRSMQSNAQGTARRQSSQRTLAADQLQQMVLRCDLVLVDGNSMAVGLQCDPSTTSIPRLITKGKGALADKIKTAAKENQILLKEDHQLTRTIFRETEIQQQVSASRYQLLAHHYQDACQDNRPSH